MPKKVKEAYDKMHKFFRKVEKAKKLNVVFINLDYWIRRERK